MTRGLMVVLACAAAVAQAQEVAGAGKASNRTVRAKVQEAAEVAKAPNPAVRPEGGARAAIPAARTTLGLRMTPLPRSTGPADGGVAATSASTNDTSDRRTDCSGYETLLDGEVPVVRTYAPPPSRSSRGNSGNAIEWPPYVRAVQRCGSLYLVQISNRSKALWAVAHATVEGPNGEALHVNAF